jgi:hypothetical protein
VERILHVAARHARCRVQRLRERHADGEKRGERARHLQHFSPTAQTEPAAAPAFAVRRFGDVEHEEAARFERTRQRSGAHRLRVTAQAFPGSIDGLIREGRHRRRSVSTSSS